jgi:hypothetical protein
MGTIVCQDCNETIQHFEDEKVTILIRNAADNATVHLEEE